MCVLPVYLPQLPCTVTLRAGLGCGHLKKGGITKVFSKVLPSVLEQVCSPLLEDETPGMHCEAQVRGTPRLRVYYSSFRDDCSSHQSYLGC